VEQQQPQRVSMLYQQYAQQCAGKNCYFFLHKWQKELIKFLSELAMKRTPFISAIYITSTYTLLIPDYRK